MSTIKVDTVRPVTTDGSLTLQGDSSGSGVSGITIDSSGNATLGGNLVIGAAGKGIDFSGAQTALSGTTDEVFSGYEIGTYTSNRISLVGSSGTWPSTASGTYIKIGDFCQFSIYISGTNMNFSSTSGYTSWGIPFSAASANVIGGATVNTAHTASFKGVGTVQSTSIFVYLASVTGSSSGSVYINGFYQTV